MFLLNKTVLDSLKKPDRLLVYIAPVFIFFALLIPTFWGWEAAKKRVQEDRQEAVTESVNYTLFSINQNLRDYEQVLKAGASLFSASETVNREEWKTFVDIFDIDSNYPGIQTIGFAQVVENNKLASHVREIRNSGQSNYQVSPAGQRPVYSPVIFSEPGATSPTSQIIGFDMYSNADRRAAMETARDTARGALTNRIILRGDQNREAPPASFIMYYPVYKTSPVPQQKAQRIENIAGYVYTPLRTMNVFDPISAEDNSSYGFRIYAGEVNQENLLYESPDFQTVSQAEDVQIEQRKFRFNDSEWTLEFDSSPAIGTSEIRERPNRTLIGGIMFSLLIAALVYVIFAARSRALAYSESTEVQAAKDELLALASHQLRTPATGVKQYIGMLREGFAGKLTKNQKDLLDRAHESNERQLNTISEMLYVARADAGRLSLNRSKTNITQIVEDVVAEQQKVIESRKQKLEVKMPKKNVFAQVDAQYFRMAVENVVNNASKYTPEKGDIEVCLKRGKESIRIIVEDTGVGVPARYRPLLFKKFSRIPNEMTSQVSGSGIGLYFAKFIVEAHGGTIRFDSEPNLGSVLTITVPRTGTISTKQN